MNHTQHVKSYGNYRQCLSLPEQEYGKADVAVLTTAWWRMKQQEIESEENTAWQHGVTYFKRSKVDDIFIGQRCLYHSVSGILSPSFSIQSLAFRIIFSSFGIQSPTFSSRSPTSDIQSLSFSNSVFVIQHSVSNIQRSVSDIQSLSLSNSV